ncbi:alpha/beta hydrolase [Rhodococcus koreensis]|uniref:alpha/beta hydrolase n=1 Tax=Rhodococcus koreensis TaxID=99653 RepID=UPI00367146CF
MVLGRALPRLLREQRPPHPRGEPAGHGGSPSPKPLRWVTIADYVDDVAAVADELPLRPVVIGHSMGGYIVQKYLESYCAPVGVLLASAPSGGIWRSTLRTLRRHPRALLAETLTLSPYRLVGTLELARDHMFQHRCLTPMWSDTLRYCRRTVTGHCSTCWSSTCRDRIG